MVGNLMKSVMHMCTLLLCNLIKVKHNSPRVLQREFLENGLTFCNIAIYILMNRGHRSNALFTLSTI